MPADQIVATSIIAVWLFLTTLSFLVTAPGVGEIASGGFPALSLTGQFLIKDVALIGIAVWTLGDALVAAGRRFSSIQAAPDRAAQSTYTPLNSSLGTRGRPVTHDIH